MKDWYQYRPWNLTHRAQLRESGHMTYRTTALIPNSCSPMADGPFRDPKGRSYPHPKYWTYRWRININFNHEIYPTVSCLNNLAIWDFIRLHYQILTAQWFIVRIPVYILSTQQILVLLTEDWYQGQYPSPFMACRQEDGLTWKTSRLPSVEIAASQRHLVSFRTPRFCPIYTTNFGRIDKLFIARHPPNRFNCLSLRIWCDME